MLVSHSDTWMVGTDLSRPCRRVRSPREHDESVPTIHVSEVFC